MSKQNQHNLRTAAGEVRRRASNVQRPMSSSSNGSAADPHSNQHHGGLPGIDPSGGSGGGWAGGFNGVVFGGSGGGELAGLSGLLGTASTPGANGSSTGLASRAHAFDSHHHHHHPSANGGGTGAGADHTSPSAMHQVPRLNVSVIMDHIAVLQRENAQLRRHNQTLTSASNMRRQTAVKLLREIVNKNNDTDSDGSGDDDGSSRRSSLSGSSPSKTDLTSLLLSLLDAPDSETVEGSSQEDASQDSAALNVSANPADNTAPVAPTDGHCLRDSAIPSRIHGNQRSATPRSTTAVGTADWDRDALAEISRQGKVANADEGADDEYSKQTQRAIGQRGPFLLGRRSTMTMPARKRHSMSSTHSARSNTSGGGSSSRRSSVDAEKDKIINSSGVSHPGAYPTAEKSAEGLATAAPAYESPYINHTGHENVGIVSSPVQDGAAEFGPLATSLMNQEMQFVKRPDTRFILYSASAGIFESHSLDGLRSGDMSLADIIEASTKCMTLDGLRKERLSGFEPAGTAIDKSASLSQQQKQQQHQNLQQSAQTTAAAAVGVTDDSASCKSTACEGETELFIRPQRKPEPRKQSTPPAMQPAQRQPSAAAPRTSAPATSTGGGCFWLDVTNPTNEEMASLARTFGIHPLTVEDIMADEDGRDKFETFSGYNFMVYRTIDYNEDAKSNYEFNRGTEGIATASFSVILKHSCVLTFHQAAELEHIGNVINRLQDLSPLPTLAGDTASGADEYGAAIALPPIVTPAYIAYALTDDITDTIAPEMRAIELEVDAVDELVLILSTDEQSDMLRRIGATRRKILTVWRLLQGKPEVIRAFSKLMERQALADEIMRTDMEDAEYTRKVIADSATAANADMRGPPPATVTTTATTVGRGLPPNLPVGFGVSASQTQLQLRRNHHSSAAVSQLVASTSGRRRDTQPQPQQQQPQQQQQQQQTPWPTYITGGSMPIKDRIPLAPSSTRPSTVDLVNFSASMGPGAVTSQMSGGTVTSDEVARYLSDVYDHLVSLIGSSSHCDMVLSRAHSNYLARLSLELGESTVETNVFASRWTVIGAILVPLNVVTGLWGMNVHVPGQDSGSLREFFLILGGCMAFVVAVITWAKFKKIF
ncbi:CorA metal ion transporter [Coemansia sp. RSA 1939]|nr:CorA metal ion transporter [Coemansia sp. RSA 1939]KAJ2604288.1 CorA metal ion transporter [Coemansia sp. RSA 1804]